MATRDNDSIRTGGRGRPGKIFIGGLPRETTKVQFFKHFRRYGEIKDSVIMLDPRTGLPRGFGFVTYENPSVIDKVIEETHVINGKQVVTKRTIPKGVVGTKDFKTRRIFVTGIPSSLSEGEFKDLFKQFGKIKEHLIVQDNNATNCFRGLGFITFDTEQAVDDLLDKGNKVELYGGLKILLHKVYPRWKPPPKGFLKLNSDGSSAANPGEAGAGGIIRNDQGQWIVGYSRKLGQATSTCAELWGVRDGLQLAVKRGLFDVIIEVDSQVVLDLIFEEVVDSHILGPIIKECRSLLEQIPNHRLCQINRESNSCADHLARMGATMTKDFVIFGLPPDCIKLFLFTESLEPEDNEVIYGGETNEFKSLNHAKDDSSLPQTECGASPSKIFIGGLARDTTSAQFLEHFGKYGEIVDSVIMKNKETGQRRGFGFVTYADPSVVDKVIEDTHIVNGKQVEIKRVEPKKQIPLAPLSELHGDSRNAYNGFEDSYGGCVGDRFDNIGYRSGGSGPHWGGAARCAGYDGAEFGGYRGYGSGMELYGQGVGLEYSGHCAGGEFGHCGDGSGMEPYRGEPSLKYSGHHGGGEFGRLKCYGGVMEAHGGEPLLEYSGHCGRDEFGDGMEPYRGEPSECFRHVDGGQFGGYGGAIELFREEPFDEHPSRSRGGFNGGYDVGHGYGGPTEIYGEYGVSGIARGYRGGGGGSFFGHRGGHGGLGRGHWYHPYAR